MIKDDDIASMVERARRFAALSAEFDPVDAVKASFGERDFDPPVAARIMGHLRTDCTEAADGRCWVMRQSPRDRVLAQIDDAEMEEALRWSLPDDAVATTLRRVLATAPHETQAQIEVMIQEPAEHVDELETLTRAIELAGPKSDKTYDMLPAMHGALNRQYAVRRAEEQLAQGYFGNDELLRELGKWVPKASGEKLARALYIRGIPGVGKSFLLTKFVQNARESVNPIVLWLDFDRRALNLVEPDGLTMELARQLGNEVPDYAVELSQLRAHDSGVASQYSSKRGHRSMSIALAEAMGKAVQSSGRQVVVILDTLEVLASYGDSHPDRLFDYLDDLLRFGLSPAAIIAAGRGDALKSLRPDRVANVLPLDGLPDEFASKMLSKLGTPQDAVAPILKLAHGNPLILRLAAKLAREDGADAIDVDQIKSQPPEVASGYLYRAILSRIEGEQLCEIANLGLVMHKVDAGAIQSVIAPALGFEVSPEEAGELLDQLSAHHWLVEEEPGGWVRHRSDVREVILRLLYAGRREQVRKVNQLAAQYFAETDPVAALYHQLQALEDGEELPAIGAALAAGFSKQMIRELGGRKADAVLNASGELSLSGRGAGGATADEDQIAGAAQPEPQERPKAERSAKQSARSRSAARKAAARGTATPGPSVLTDLRILLERGDLIEAQALFDDAFDTVPPLSEPAGTAAMCHFWLSGQWAKAQKLYRQCETADFSHARWDGADALVQTRPSRDAGRVWV